MQVDISSIPSLIFVFKYSFYFPWKLIKINQNVNTTFSPFEIKYYDGRSRHNSADVMQYHQQTEKLNTKHSSHSYSSLPAIRTYI